MTESEAASTSVTGREGHNLLLRVVATLVMAPLAIAAAYAGGWAWSGLVTAGAIGLYIEWLGVVGARKPILISLGIVVLLGLCWVETVHMTTSTVAAIAIAGIFAVAVFSGDRRTWVSIGMIYALAALVGSIAVRLDADWGFAALMFVLLVVWVTDIGGYFAGRLIGGPKLWQRVSPKKTWAGAVGGFAGSLCIAIGFFASGLGRVVPLLLLGAALSVISQLGDLFESAVKRRFGVKDSSHIIPGHGGLMDRLDGFVAAIVLAAIFGFWRGGADGVARGLMVW